MKGVAIANPNHRKLHNIQSSDSAFSIHTSRSVEPPITPTAQVDQQPLSAPNIEDQAAQNVISSQDSHLPL